MALGSLRRSTSHSQPLPAVAIAAAPASPFSSAQDALLSGTPDAAAGQLPPSSFVAAAHALALGGRGRRASATGVAGGPPSLPFSRLSALIAGPDHTLPSSSSLPRTSSNNPAHAAAAPGVLPPLSRDASGDAAAWAAPASPAAPAFAGRRSSTGGGHAFARRSSTGYGSAATPNSPFSRFPGLALPRLSGSGAAPQGPTSPGPASSGPALAMHSPTRGHAPDQQQRIRSRYTAVVTQGSSSMAPADVPDSPGHAPDSAPLPLLAAQAPQGVRFGRRCSGSNGGASPQGASTQLLPASPSTHALAAALLGPGPPSSLASPRSHRTSDLGQCSSPGLGAGFYAGLLSPRQGLSQPGAAAPARGAAHPTSVENLRTSGAGGVLSGMGRAALALPHLGARSSVSGAPGSGGGGGGGGGGGAGGGLQTAASGFALASPRPSRTSLGGSAAAAACSGTEGPGGGVGGGALSKHVSLVQEALGRRKAGTMEAAARMDAALAEAGKHLMIPCLE